MKKDLIIISGFAGSGKSSLADSLGEAFGMRVIHASAILRDMSVGGLDALKEVSHEKIKDWWESDAAKKFMEKRMKDGSLDRALDERLLEIAEGGNVVLDSWTMPYLYNGSAFRVWLEASPEERARRVSKRDSLDYGEVLRKVRSRDEETKALYERLYNFRMGKELERFDLVLKTDKMTQEGVLEKALGEIRKRE